MFFDRWSDVGRVMVLGAVAYAVMVAVLRISGKRALAKLNAFDLVVTVALGSVLATIALSSDVSLTDGVTAISILVFGQWVVSWSSARMSAVGRLVRAEATVVLRDGCFDDELLRPAVVLETDGTMSVITSDRCGSGSALPAAQPIHLGDRRR